MYAKTMSELPIAVVINEITKSVPMICVIHIQGNYLLK